MVSGLSFLVFEVQGKMLKIYGFKPITPENVQGRVIPDIFGDAETVDNADRADVARWSLESVKNVFCTSSVRRGCLIQAMGTAVRNCFHRRQQMLPWRENNNISLISSMLELKLLSSEPTEKRSRKSGAK